MATPRFLRDCLPLALSHWGSRPGGPVMSSMASRCVSALGGSTLVTGLSAASGVSLLATLRKAPYGLSPKSVSGYYGAFKRMLALNGISTVGWPNAPTPPRKTRDALNDDDYGRLKGRLAGVGSGETADLLTLLRATGMRVAVEALSAAAIRVSQGDEFDTLHITGKGGHERLLPVVGSDARALLRDAKRLDRMRALGYSAHLKRWSRAAKSLGIATRRPTPHSVRHAYAGEAYARSGGNLVMVQELLGHADPATTGQYLAVDLKAKAKALSGLQ